MEDKNITLKTSELTAMLAEVSEKAVEAKFKTLDSATKKFSAGYNGAVSEKSAEEFASMEKKAKFAGFIKAIYHQDKTALAMYKGMNETTGSAGGFVVPEEFASEVNRVVEDFGLVPKLARKFPMSHDVLNVPRLSATVSVSYPGEAIAGTPSQPVLEKVILTAKTLVGLTPMSNELLADANISVVDLLVELFAEAIAGELDAQGLAGTGSPFTGIMADANVGKYYIGGSSTSTKMSISDATLGDCRMLINQVKPWALQGATFVMHRTVWSFLSQEKASTTGEYQASSYNPVVIGTSAQQGFPTAQAGTLWGYAVYLSDKMPVYTASDVVSTKYVIFGNLKHLYMGVRNEMGVSISDSATIGADNLFAQNMSAVRVTARHALAVGLPTAFACLETSAS